MLIGCCHCDEKKERPSSSEVSSDGPPSDNSDSGSVDSGSASTSVDSASYSTEIATCADDACIGGVVARRYRITFIFSSTDGCGPEYNGTFTVENGYDVFGNTNTLETNEGCVWSSLQLRSIDEETGDPVYTGTVSRYWQDGIVCADSGLARFTLVIFGTVVWVGVHSGGPSIQYELTTTTPISCLGTMTLALTSPPLQCDRFVQTITGVASSGSACPATVTVTPV